MSNKRELEVVALTTWITAPIAILLCLRVIYKEIQNRRTVSNKNNNSNNNPYQKWLNRFSMITMILLVLQLVMNLIHKLPIICKYTYPFIAIPYFLAQCSLSTYHTMKLQYSFSSERIHNQHGYSSYTFYILYSIIATISLYIIIISWIPFNLNTNTINGCTVHISVPDEKLYIFPLIGTMFFMHVLILTLYLIKIFQIRCSHTKLVPTIVDRVNFFLRKITLLAFVYYLNAGLGLLFIAVLYNIHWIGNIIATVIWFMNVVFAVCFVYLMVEHNNDNYERFVDIFKLKYWCCCLYLSITSVHSAGDSNSIISVDGSVMVKCGDAHNKDGRTRVKTHSVVGNDEIHLKAKALNIKNEGDQALDEEDEELANRKLTRTSTPGLPVQLSRYHGFSMVTMTIPEVGSVPKPQYSTESNMDDQIV